MGEVANLQKYRIEQQYKKYYKNPVNLAADIVYDKEKALKNITKNKMTVAQ